MGSGGAGHTENATPAAEPSAEEVICVCSGTTRGDIRSLFEQGLSLDAISRHTGALSGCGGCEWDIADWLGLLAEQSRPK